MKPVNVQTCSSGLYRHNITNLVTTFLSRIMSYICVRIVRHLLDTFKFHSFELCLVNRFAVSQLDWKIYSLRITHDILQIFHDCKKVKSIYLKRARMKFVNVPEL